MDPFIGYFGRIELTESSQCTWDPLGVPGIRICVINEAQDSIRWDSHFATFCRNWPLGDVRTCFVPAGHHRFTTPTIHLICPDITTLMFRVPPKKRRSYYGYGGSDPADSIRESMVALGTTIANDGTVRKPKVQRPQLTKVERIMITPDPEDWDLGGISNAGHKSLGWRLISLRQDSGCSTSRRQTSCVPGRRLRKPEKHYSRRLYRKRRVRRQVFEVEGVTQQYILLEHRTSNGDIGQQSTQYQSFTL
ncbi:hypothetical protein BC629DRAFT_1050734 [Irpex lacteus]|nr:hypothetical protein BC629DRAFT_1050734 [Irpex lacteus]